jgi:hypothetical protein
METNLTRDVNTQACISWCKKSSLMCNQKSKRQQIISKMQKNRQVSHGMGSINKLTMYQRYSEGFFDLHRTHSYHKFYSKFSFGPSCGWMESCLIGKKLTIKFQKTKRGSTVKLRRKLTSLKTTIRKSMQLW